MIVASFRKTCRVSDAVSGFLPDDKSKRLGEEKKSKFMWS